MNKIETIRYMGIKTHLLDYIIPAIQEITPNSGTVLDLMAGSNAVSYALKEYFTVYTNDIQEYSKIISDAIIVNQAECISAASAKSELVSNYQLNERKKYFNFFESTYAGTYFSQKQCSDIDSLRYSIEQIPNPSRKALYLFALMGAMCKVQSTPGHFAQYMPSFHSRIVPLQRMDLLKEFYSKCNLYTDICFTDTNNKSFNMDFHELLSRNICGDIDTIYLDSPYTQEQYSRFYHILETVVKYDNPAVAFKAKYRENRFQSAFCYKGKVAKEFTSVFEYCKEHSVNLLVSYSEKGLISIEDLQELASTYFQHVKKEYIDYKHSTQGKGSNKVKEVLLSCISR